MHTPKPKLLIVKIMLKKALLLGLMLMPIYLPAATTELPPNLSDTASSVLHTGSDIKTPEYVIIRANEQPMFSSETTGTVINLPVKEGSHFKKGDVLLQLDCRLQQAELKKAMSQQWASSKALQSAKKLKSYGAISEFEWVKASAEAEGANADVDKLKAIVEKCTVIAPFSGGVAELKTHLHETVKPGDPLLKVTNTQNLSVEIQVPSKWLTWLHIGSKFNVYVNDLSKEITADVISVNPEIEPISQTVKITGQVSPPEPSLKPGMTGQAIFHDNPDSNKE